MARYGKSQAYQFAISTGTVHTKEARAPLLKPPPGRGWELIFVQFVTDWYTVWRRPKDGHSALREAEELEQEGYEPPGVEPAAQPPEGLNAPGPQPVDDAHIEPALRSKNLGAQPRSDWQCPHCQGILQDVCGVLVCDRCDQPVYLVSEIS